MNMSKCDLKNRNKTKQQQNDPNPMHTIIWGYLWF